MTSLMQISVDARLEGDSNNHAWSRHKGLWALGQAHHLARNRGEWLFSVDSERHLEMYLR